MHRSESRATLRWAGAACLLAMCAAFISCTSVNHLDRYQFDGRSLAANMRLPPEPKLDVFYFVHANPKLPFAAVLNIGTNFAKAASAEEAEGKMRRALVSVNVPVIVLKETFYGSSTALATRMTDSPQEADYLLDLEINEYGIHADSPNGSVKLRIKTTARIYDQRSRDLVWRRTMTQSSDASPQMFGLGPTIGNVLAATALADMSEEELETGFTNLAKESAREMSRRLEKDLYEVRYRNE
jgi:hypothetical protein